jgi:hypothetical protein
MTRKTVSAGFYKPRIYGCRIVMDLDKITDYCKLRKVINYGKARS